MSGFRTQSEDYKLGYKDGAWDSHKVSERTITAQQAEIERLRFDLKWTSHEKYKEKDERIAELEQLEESNGELRREMDAQLAKLEKVAEAAIDVVSFFDGKLTLDDEGYFELESLECYLRGAGYYLEEDSK